MSKRSNRKRYLLRLKGFYYVYGPAKKMADNLISQSIPTFSALLKARFQYPEEYLKYKLKLKLPITNTDKRLLGSNLDMIKRNYKGENKNENRYEENLLSLGG